MSFDDRATLIEEWSEEAKRWYRSIGETRNKYRDLMCAAGVMSVGLVTFKYQPEMAESFWGSVGDNDGLRSGTPEQALVNLILCPTGGLVRKKQEAHLYARAVAGCWNSYFLGRSRRSARGRSGNVAIVIEGTPFDGREPREFLKEVMGVRR